MPKFQALKAFTGQEGNVRVGQVLDTSEFPTLTKNRVDELKRRNLIADYSDKMAAAPLNKAALRTERAEPAGVRSPNVAGITELGWEPGAGAEGGADHGTFAGQGEGEAAGDGQNGSSTSTIGSESLSRRGRPPKAPVTSSGARPKRGNRSAS